MVIRKSKIEELTNDKVIPLIERELNNYGFKYQKTKGFFIRRENGFSQIISVYTPRSPLSYDEDAEQLYFIFNISAKLETPDYEKWFLEKFGEKTYFSVRIENLTSQIELSFDDFDCESFYEPTASQQFKHHVSLLLADGNSQNRNIIPINEFLKVNVPKLVSELVEKSDILQIYETSEFPFMYMYLLAYGGYTEIADKVFLQYYQRAIDDIENKLKISEAEASSSIEALNKFIKNIQKISSLSFTSPFNRSIKILESQNDTFDFSQKTKFIEKLRLDISQFDIKSLNINKIGDILLFISDNQKIIKLNSKGELIFEKEIETKKGFDKIFWSVPSGVIKGTNNFFVNNYIITENNQLLELLLPIQKIKKGRLQNPNIADLSYWNTKDKYLVIYEDNFLVYSKNGELERAMNIGQNYRSRIIVEKEWIIIYKYKDSINIILNFNGETVGTYECGNGNHLYEFSTNYEYLICFFYSTKSQFYDLAKGKKGVLWAHPTFIKDYKEKMYNDVSHNFGMTIAKFSPDNKYIVGGADHGKYVAWTLPKLERIELIPQNEMIELLEPDVVIRLYDATNINEKAELVVLDNQTFLKNRGSDISKIIFFENGDIFITELGSGKFVLSWDRNFVNLTFKKINGRLDFHSQKFLTQKTKTELIIYEQA